MVGQRGNITVVDFAGRFHDVNKSEVQKTLHSLGYLRKDSKGKWQVRSQYRDKLFGMNYSPNGYSVITVLEKGKTRPIH